jgi:uncharacterized protein
MHARTFASVTSVAVLLLCIATITRPPLLTAAAAGPGEFVWHDLVTDNPEACRTFYGALFGWTFESAEGVDPGYIIIKQAGRMIGGIVRPKPQADGTAVVPQWLSYLLVDDVNRTTEAVRQAGGRVYRGPLTVQKDVRVAVVGDAQGAPFGLASRGPRDMEAGPPGLHHWLWMEYVAVDTEAALKFYGDVIGFRYEVQKTRDDFTYYLLTTDRPHAGLFRSIWPRQTSAWLPYVRVADPAAMAARAAELGGTIMLAPSPGVRGGSLAIVLDPTGAPVALQKYPFESGSTP